jgi:hypothetical protein
MDGDQLALKGGYQLCDSEPMLLQKPCNLVGVGLAFSTTMEIKKPGVRARELQPHIA